MTFSATCALLITSALSERVVAQAVRTDPDLVTQQADQAMQRYEQILRSRPQVGTAFDKFYAELEKVNSCASYCDDLRAEADRTNDGRLFQLLGLLLIERGLASEAVEAFSQAETGSYSDATTSLYLAKAHALTRNFSQAQESLLRSLDRRPHPNIVAEILNELVRVHGHLPTSPWVERLGNKVQLLFAANVQVMRKLSDAYLKCDAPTLAKPVVEQLIGVTKSPTERMELQMRLADIKTRMGDREAAIADYELLLRRAEPESWLYGKLLKEIEGQVESQSGLQGLIAYYEKRLSTSSDDLRGWLRLADLLCRDARRSEAREVIQQILERYPHRPEPLLAQAEWAIAEQDYLVAAKSMERLVELDSSNADYLVAWGRYLSLVPADDQQPPDNKAAEIWRRLLENRGNDPTTLLKVAELMHSIARFDEATELYRRAWQVSGNAQQYREYYGEYLNRLGRREAALQVWQDVPDAQQNPESYVRLCEVLSQFRFSDEALQAIERACELKAELESWLRCAELLRERGRYQEAVARLDTAEAMVSTVGELDRVWNELLVTLPFAAPLDERLERLMSLSTQAQSEPQVWRQVALTQLASGNAEAAATTAIKATELEPDSAVTWTLAAKVFRRAELVLREQEARQVLCRLDRPNKLLHLQRISEIQMQFKRIDDALLTVEQMLAEPAATEQHFKYFAVLCNAIGNPQKAVTAVEKLTRSNPADARAWLLLAQVFSNVNNHRRAEENAWMCLKHAQEESLRRDALDVLRKAYNGSERLLELALRLEQFGEQQNRMRDALMWVAKVQQERGDMVAAWGALERALALRENDLELLKFALEIAQAIGKYDAAVDCQRRLIQLDPNPQGQLVLGELMLRAGDERAATRQWSTVLRERSQMTEAIAYVRSQLIRNEYSVAAGVVEAAQKTASDNWELLALGIVANQKLKSTDRVLRLADSLLEMPLGFDQPAQYLESQMTANNSGGHTVVVARDNAAAGVEAVDTRRLAWLERADQWQEMFNEADVNQSAIRLADRLSATTRRIIIQQLALNRGADIPSAAAPTIYLPTFGDARAIAVLAKYGRINQAHRAGQPSHSLESYVEASLQSHNANQLWDCILLLQPLFSKIMTTDPTGGRFLHDASSPVASQYLRLLQALADSGDSEAIQLALNDILFRRNMQFQLSAKWNQTLHPLPEDELARFKRLVDLRLDRPVDAKLLAAMVLASEFSRSGRQLESGQVFTRALEQTNNLDEIDRCTQEIYHVDPHLARRIVAETFRRHHNASHHALVAMFDEAWHRDGKQPGEQTRQFLALFIQLLELQGQYIDTLGLAEFAWDHTTKLDFVSYSPSNEVMSVASDFIRPSTILNATLLTTLRYMRAVAREGLHHTLEELLSNELNSQPTGVQLVRRLCLSHWRWWRGEAEAATAPLAQGQQAKGNSLLALYQSQLLIHSGRASEALALLQSFQAVNRVQNRDAAMLKLEAAYFLSDQPVALDALRVLTSIPLTGPQQALLGRITSELKLTP